MEEFSKKCKIEQNDLLGRYVTAAVDLKAGETVLSERPVVIFPSEGEKRCANCLKLAENFCSTCHIFPLCNICTQHYEYDCKLFAELKELRVEVLQKHPEAYGVLKCLLLRENPETVEYFETLLQMEAHMEKRRSSEIWKEHHEKVVQPILGSGLVQHLRNAEEINEDFLQKLGCIADVNCFEIRAPDVGTLRGVYPQAAIFAHSCMANTLVAVDAQFQMKMYVNRDVAQGETLNHCYTNVLLGTDERRNALRTGKYFDCKCERCEDPTELGSHMSSFVCARCALNQREGFVVKKQSNLWQCMQCEHTLKVENVEELLDRAKEEIFHAKGDIYRYELLLAKLSRYFHRNHYLMVDLKQNIAAILRSIIQNLAQRPGRKVYERKVQLCQELLLMMHIIQPGISRLKAILFYELSNASAEMYRLRFGEHDLSESELLVMNTDIFACRKTLLSSECNTLNIHILQSSETYRKTTHTC